MRDICGARCAGCCDVQASLATSNRYEDADLRPAESVKAFRVYLASAGRAADADPSDSSYPNAGPAGAAGVAPALRAEPTGDGDGMGYAESGAEGRQVEAWSGSRAALLVLVPAAAALAVAFAVLRARAPRRFLRQLGDRMGGRAYLPLDG